MKFKAKVWKSGDSCVITIPSFLIKNEGIEVGKEYLIRIGVVDDAEQSE